MKKNHLFMMLGILSILNAALWADVIVPNTHYVACCVRIQNTAEFPDIVVIEYVGTAVNGTGYFINPDSCVYQGPKYIPSYFLWAAKSYVDSVGLANLPIPAYISGLSKRSAADSSAAPPIHLLSKDIGTHNYLVPDSNKIIAEEIFYSLYTSNVGISIYMAKDVSHFSDGTSSTQTFSQPSGVVSPILAAARKTTIENIVVTRGIFAFKTEFTGMLEMMMIDCKGRIAGKYVKSCAPGCTYVTDLSGMKSGLYWIRLKTPNIDVVKRLTIIR